MTAKSQNKDCFLEVVSPENNKTEQTDVAGTATIAADLTTVTGLVEHLAEAIIVVSETGHIRMINSKAAQFLGLPVAELTGKFWPDFLVSRFQLHFQNIVKMGHNRVLPMQHQATEMALVRANGDVQDVELSVSYLPGVEAQYVLVLRDLTRYKTEYLKLRTLAATDALTELANRRYFDEMLEQYWGECTDKRRPVSVVIIDVDYFKLFNDQFGHIHGDECLRKIATAISTALPAGAGLAARYGGEEFALILPNYNEKMAQAVAVKVQKNIRSLTFIDQGLPEHVSVSVSQGIASEINGQFRTSLALMCAADTALYRAKADGRDCINISC